MCHNAPESKARMLTAENMITLPGYEILETLPKGGMSTVYKARQVSLDRLVAIKVLPSAVGVDPEDVEKFMAEARITAGLKHPNIVRVYDFGQSAAGVYFLVMEYISGYTVASWIRRKGCLSEENSLLCGLNVAMAMNYAWQKAGIVHCDIKPDNVIIDGDGTVKLADLGLARSVKSIVNREPTDEKLVFGTPNYISPEQSRGDEPLDCRADIYSLGAMLYHCLTGVMPFEGRPPFEVMDRQITDQIPDPQDVNPRVSVWSAGLIEKMMAKECAFRPRDWEEAIGDISNVRSEMMPQVSLPAAAVSTVKRSPLREARLREVYRPPEKETPPPAPVAAPAARRRPIAVPGRKAVKAASLAALALLAAGIFIVFFAGDKRPAGQAGQAPAAQPPQTLPPEPARAAALPEAERAAMARYAQTVAWLKENPLEFEEARARCRQLADEVKGTKAADLARAAAQQLERAIEEIKALLARLDQQADRLAVQGRFLEAAAVYEKYRGAFENETAAARQSRARVLRGKQARLADEQQRQQGKAAEFQLQDMAAEIAAIIVEADLAAAQGRMRELAGDLPLIAPRPEFRNLAELLEKASGAEQRIVDSFRPLKNSPVTVAFATGPTNVFIRDVQGDLVIAERIIALDQGTLSVRKNFRVQDLTLDEKITRLGEKPEPEYALMRTILALDGGDGQLALAAAARTGPLLSAPLTEAVKKANEQRAAQALFFIFQRAGLSASNQIPPPANCLRTLKTGKISQRKGQELIRGVGQFRAHFGFADLARQYNGVLEALTNAASRRQAAARPAAAKTADPPPSFQELSAAVVSNLVALNKGLREDQIVLQADDAGRLRAVEIVSRHLRDLKPLENLTTLQSVVCAGLRQHVWMETPPSAPLDDLTPLKLLRLEKLALNHTRVKDLAPISQMPLISLNLAHTKASDLQPLKDLPLRELDISFSAVRDIRPLTGLALISLDLSGTRIKDLSALEGMPLRFLNISQSNARDISSLRDLPLKTLALRGTEITDLTPLQDSGIEEIWMDDLRNQANSEKIRLMLEVLARMPKLQRVNGRPLWMLRWKSE